MNKREIFDQVSDMEQQIGELYEQLGDLKNQIADLLETNHRLSMENHHLRNRFDEPQEEKVAKDERSELNLPGEGYDNLARLYDEGFHICNLEFGSPRRNEDCMFCLDFLSKAK
ncbi:MAG TPA: DNA replication initiation control protein YabA [Bacillota bacterium]|nr:DNA replication initiation control protein YabA [Bacillota bacterium]